MSFYLMRDTRGYYYCTSMQIWKTGLINAKRFPKMGGSFRRSLPRALHVPWLIEPSAAFFTYWTQEGWDICEGLVE